MRKENFTPSEIAPRAEPDLAQLQALIAADQAAAAAAQPPQRAPDGSPANPPPRPRIESRPAGQEASPPPSALEPGAEPEQTPTQQVEPERTAEQRIGAREAQAGEAMNAAEDELAGQEAPLTAPDPRPGAIPAAPGFTAAHYEAAAQQFERQGQYDLADLAREEAGRAREALAREPQGPCPTGEDPVGETGGREFLLAQAAAWQTAQRQFPDLLDPRTPLNQQTRRFLQENPDVLDHPRGPYLAVAYVANQLRSARLPALENTIESLNKKIKELEALTSLPGGGGPQVLPPERSFEELTTAEMEKHLDRLAATA